MSTAANLGNLLGVTADINYYTQQSIYWNAKYEANSEKLQKQIGYEEKWETAYEEAYGNTRDLQAKGGIVVEEGNTSEAKQIAYANAKVEHYNKEVSIELAALDVEYDTMKTMYDTLLEELRAQQEADKNATSTAAQDTGLLQS